MSKGWDNATLKKLKALTGKGLSTSEIGKRLGMSKNAIVGKLNRLGWNAKAGGAAAVEIPEKKTRNVKKVASTAKAAKSATAEKKTTVKPVTKKAAVKPVEKVTEKSTVKKTTANKKVEEPKENTKKTVTAVRNDAKSLAVHQRIIQHSLEMANLKPNQCRWPIGDPDSEHFHFCGETVFVGKPYCYEHCKQAYQFAPPKKK
jgi:GcrA cell cycle regulator